MYHDGFLACIHGGGARREGKTRVLEISSHSQTSLIEGCSRRLSKMRLKADSNL